MIFIFIGIKVWMNNMNNQFSNKKFLNETKNLIIRVYKF